jgi:hypothetical protein
VPFREIGKDEFETIVKRRGAGLGDGWAQERSWFANSDETVAGAVVCDTRSGSWGYVVLTLQDDGHFQVANANVCRSQHHARTELKAAMKRVTANPDISDNFND